MVSETHNTQSGSASAGGNESTVRAAQTGTFRKEGKYWKVFYGGTAFHLRDSRGLRYIAYLLRHPGVEFNAADLSKKTASQREEDETGESSLSVSWGHADRERLAMISERLVSDAAEMLDDRAKLAYGRRLSELSKLRVQAEMLGNVELAEQIQQEIDILKKGLSGASGRSEHGPATSASERVRVNVSKSIKSVLKKLSQNNAGLGDILSRSIRTGLFSSYQPDPDFPVAWDVRLSAGSTDLREEAKTLLPNGTAWLDTQNFFFSGRKPVDLIGTPEEFRVRDLLQAVKHGFIS